jgi:hypothetical protein
MRSAMEGRESRQRVDRQPTGKGERGEDRGLNCRAAVADEEHAQPVPSIRKHSSDRHQDDVGRRVGERDD